MPTLPRTFALPLKVFYRARVLSCACNKDKGATSLACVNFQIIASADSTLNALVRLTATNGKILVEEDHWLNEVLPSDPIVGSSFLVHWHNLEAIRRPSLTSVNQPASCDSLHLKTKDYTYPNIPNLNSFLPLATPPNVYGINAQYLGMLGDLWGDATLRTTVVAYGKTNHAYIFAPLFTDNKYMMSPNQSRALIMPINLPGTP